MQIINVDWNWFFSTFSQCGAAIIGIIGGFIIYKLIESNSSLGKIHTEFDIIVSDFQSLRKRINRINFNEYYLNFFWSSPLVWSFIQSNQLTEKDDDHLINFLYQYLIGLYKSDEIILRQIKIIISNTTSFKKDFEDPKKSNIKEKVAKVMRENIEEQIIKSGELISKFKINKKKLVSLTKEYALLRTMTIFMFSALLILVIYPMHFLPVNTSINPFYTFNFDKVFCNIISFSNILLFIFVFIMASFLIYILIIIKSNNKILEKLKPTYKEYVDINSYSEHFRAISVNPKFI